MVHRHIQQKVGALFFTCSVFDNCMITQLHHRAKYCLNIKCALCQEWQHQSCLRCRQTLNLLMKSSSYSVGPRHHDNSCQRPVSMPTIMMYWEGKQSRCQESCRAARVKSADNVHLNTSEWRDRTAAFHLLLLWCAVYMFIDQIRSKRNASLWNIMGSLWPRILMSLLTLPYLWGGCLR